jgi:hypothetical protein
MCRGLLTAEEILARLSEIPTRTALPIRADLLNEIQSQVRLTMNKNECYILQL